MFIAAPEEDPSLSLSRAPLLLLLLSSTVLRSVKYDVRDESQCGEGNWGYTHAHVVQTGRDPFVGGIFGFIGF